jgi:hypothetical protein
MKNLFFGLSRNVLDESSKYTTLSGAANGISGLIKRILGPVLTVIGVAAVLYAIYLGVMYAKAESADKRKEIQGRLIGACIGAVIIVVGATLCFSLDWANIFGDFSGLTYDAANGTYA